MRLEASEGRVVMKMWTAETKSKIIMPDNVEAAEIPTFEIVDVGDGRQSQQSGIREIIPYKKGDRVVVAAARAAILTMEEQKYFIFDWTHILGKVVE